MLQECSADALTCSRGDPPPLLAKYSSFHLPGLTGAAHHTNDSSGNECTVPFPCYSRLKLGVMGCEDDRKIAASHFGDGCWNKLPARRRTGCAGPRSCPLPFSRHRF